MIDARGRAIITDFGVARSAEEQATITIAGSPTYMAPEQLAGGLSGPDIAGSTQPPIRSKVPTPPRTTRWWLSGQMR
jgi:serine/threonine protein kinase